MSAWFWQSVVSDGMVVPSGRSLSDLTTELGDMLCDPDPVLRDGLAYPVLATWVETGVYDNLLRRLGDGLLGIVETDPAVTGEDGVFGRSFAVLVLAEIIERDARADLLADRVVRGWGDRIAAWLVNEPDLRGFVAGSGWAHAVAHGADAVAALARSPRLHGRGLVFLLDVIADRLLEPTTTFLVAGEPDRLAAATMDALRRDLVTLEDLDPWLDRLAEAAVPDMSGDRTGDRTGDPDRHPFAGNGNVQAYLRALHLQLALAPERPAIRPDLLLALFDRLRATNPAYLRPHRR